MGALKVRDVSAMVNVCLHIVLKFETIALLIGTYLVYLLREIPQISEGEGKCLPTTWQVTCSVACCYIIIIGGIANGKGDCWSKLGR